MVRVLGVILLLSALVFTEALVEGIIRGEGWTFAGVLFAVGLPIFCYSVALACLWTRSRPVTLRVMGGVMFFVGLVNLIGLEAHDTKTIFGKTWFSCAFGLPGLYMLIYGRVVRG